MAPFSDPIDDSSDESQAQDPGCGHPLRHSDAGVLDERIEGVLAVVYSVFTEGYAAASGMRRCSEGRIAALAPSR